MTISGQITDGSSSFAVTKVRSGTVSLSNANSYDGGTTISSGTFAISNGSALHLSNDITFSRDISLSGAGVGGHGALRSVSANNVYSGTATFLANNTRIKVDAGQLDISGDLTDSGNNYGLDKFGAGVLLVSGSLASAPIFHVVEGDLRITGSDSSLVTLYGGTISGTGTASAIDHASGSSGTVNPGTGDGTTGMFTTTGGFQIGTTGTTHIDIGGTTAGTTYDQIVNTTSGSVDITGATLAVALVNGFIPANGDVFTVIDKQNSGAVTGTFDGLSEGATFELGAATFEVSYTGGDGNDVTLTVVGVTYTWVGLGGDSNWSTAANWDASQAPTGGEDLVFPLGAARLSNNNDLSGLSFHSITIAASDYDINGNAITLTSGLSFSSASGTAEFHPNIALAGTATIDVVDGGDFIVSGAISGSGFGITKTGGGTLEYTGFSANTYTGTTIVHSCALFLNRASGLNAIAGDLVIGDNVGVGEYVQVGNSNQIADTSTVTVNEGATFDLSTATDTINSITLQGASVTVSSGGVLGISNIITSNAATTHATSTILGAGTMALSNPNGTLLPITVAQDSNANVDLRIGTSITANNRGIQKLGDGTLALAGTSSTYDSNTNAEGGILLIETDTAIGNTNTVVVATGGSIEFAGANLSIDRGINIANGAGFNGGNAIGVRSGSTTITGPIGLFADARIGAASNSTLTITSSIFEDTDPPFFGITVDNGTNGRTVLSGDNSTWLQGSIDVLSGFLGVANDNALGMPGVSTTVTVQSGATLELAGGITIPASKTIAISGLPVANSSKIVSLSGDNTIEGDIPITGGNNESFDVASGTTLTVAGVISGARDFDKNNTRTLILTGINTNTGNVNVGDGKLLVNGSLATSNQVFVDGTLGDSGTVSDVVISGIGTLSPGNSPGLLTMGDLTFDSTGSTYVVELDGTTPGTQYDQADVTGVVILDGATLSVSLRYAPAIADTFTIINNDGIDPISGTFNGLPEGSAITLGATTLTISYAGGTGNNDVVLTVTDVVYTWDGGDADDSLWSSPDNWVGDAAPNGGANLVFPDGAARKSSTNDFASNTNFHSITIADAGYSLGGNAIDLDAGLSSSYSSGTSTLSLDIALQATSTIEVSAGGTLSLSGAISGASFGVNKEGDGTLRYEGSIANTYSGTTTINAGTMQLAKSDDVIAANGSVIVGATLEVHGNNQFWVGADVTVNEGSTFNVGTHVEHISNLNLQGSTVQIDAGGVLETFVGINTYLTTNNVTSAIEGLGALGIDNSFNTFTIADDSDLAVELRISAVLQGSTSASGFYKQRAGTLALSGSNTFSGNAVVDSGVIQVESDTAFGDSIGTTTVSGGASVFFVGLSLELAETFTISGAGIGSSGALYVMAGSTTLSDPVALADDSQIGANDGSTLTINGTISGLNTQLTFVQGVNSGKTFLSGTNDYSGGTTIASGTVAISNPSAFGSGTVTVGDGTANSGQLELDLTGTNYVNNTFIFDAPITTALLVNSGATIFLGGTTLNESLGIDEASGTSLHFAGPINDQGQARSLTKGGRGHPDLQRRQHLHRHDLRR